MSATNECLKKAIDNIIYHNPRNEEGCKSDQNSIMAKASLKMMELNIKACNVYGKLQPDEVIQRIKQISHRLWQTSSTVCDSNDLDFLLNEISDIATYIIGMTDTGFNNCTSD
jgi:hypothetical protein